MNGDQVGLWLTVGGAVALVLLLVCALLWRTSHRLVARVEALEAERSERSERSERLGAPGTAAPVAADPSPYVITRLDDAEPDPVDAVGGVDGVVNARIDAPMFADIVARETVIKAAGLAHGLRRALSAETRNRIRFEIKREVKRSRKQRRAEMKAALRDAQARERAHAAERQDGEDAA